MINTFYHLSYIQTMKAMQNADLIQKSSVCPAEKQNQSNLIFSVETTTALSLHHTTSLSTFLGFNGWGTGKAPASKGNSELPAQSSSEILPLHQGHPQPDSPNPTAATAHWDSEKFHKPDKFCTACNLLGFLNINFKDIPYTKVPPTKGIRFWGFFSSHIIPNASKLSCSHKASFLRFL